MTTPTARVPRPTASSSPTPLLTKTFTLADIVSKDKPQPKRYGLHTKAGWGKTSFGCYFPKPIVLMTREETGLLALIEYGRVPETAHFPELMDWAELNAAIDFLRDGDHDRRTMVLDVANGAERLCHEFVCERDYNNDWTERGFAGYQRGYDTALSDWRLLLNKIDQMRVKRDMTVLFLFHSRIKTFKNPAGADFDKWAPQMHEKTWALTQGWLDCLLFGDYEITVADARGKVAEPGAKGKARGVSTRILYTSSDNPVFDAKNRMGLPEEIEVGEDAEEAFKNFSVALKAARPTATAAPAKEEEKAS